MGTEGVVPVLIVAFELDVAFETVDTLEVTLVIIVVVVIYGTAEVIAWCGTTVVLAESSEPSPAAEDEAEKDAERDKVEEAGGYVDYKVQC